MSDEKDNVIPFRSKNTDATPAKAAGPEAGIYEFHLYGSESDPIPLPVVAEGYLKFGPAFIAVTEGPEDVSTIIFAAQTNVVKYLERVELFVEPETEDGAPDA